jgi:hypothetical protein
MAQAAGSCKEDYMKDTALKVAGIIFFIVSVMHLLRLILKTEVIIAGSVVPVWASVFGFIIPLWLALWMFKSVKASK